MKRTLVIAAIAFGVAVPSASGVESTIVPGVGIGKVKLGMTLAQVKRVLGPPQALNKQLRLGQGRRYVEYGWDFSEWRVGFVGGATLRVALVGTGLGVQRLANGVGVGTPVERLTRKLPVFCRKGLDGYEHPYRDPATRSGYYCVLRSGTSRTTVFLIYCNEQYVYTCHGYHVGQVIVREPI